MKIYSAELLPVLSSEIGRPARLSLLPVTEFDPNNYFEGGAQNAKLRCPLVVTLTVNDDRPTITQNVDRMQTICERARSNLATRANEEHIYKMDASDLRKISISVERLE